MPERHATRARIRRAFDAAAPRYDACARIQHAVCMRLAGQLRDVPPVAGRILDAGSGTGTAAPALQAHSPQAMLVQLDLAPAMLDIAAARPERPRALQVCGDVAALPFADGAFDFAWSSLALQWADDLALALRELRRMLRPGACLLCALLGPATLHELRAAFAGEDGHAHVNRFPAREAVAAALREAGFAEAAVTTRPLVAHYADLRGVLADVKNIGAHTVTESRRAGLTGRAYWARVAARYEAQRTAQGLPATYEVLEVLANASDAA